EVRKELGRICGFVADCQSKGNSSQAEQILAPHGLWPFDYVELDLKHGVEKLPGFMQAQDKAAYLRAIATAVKRASEGKGVSQAPLGPARHAHVYEREPELNRDEAKLLDAAGKVYTLLQKIGFHLDKTAEEAGEVCGLTSDMVLVLQRASALSSTVVYIRDDKPQVLDKLRRFIVGGQDSEKLLNLSDLKQSLEVIASKIERASTSIWSRYPTHETMDDLTRLGSNFPTLKTFKPEAEKAPTKRTGRGKQKEEVAELTANQREILTLVGKIADTIYLNCDDAPIEIEEKKLASMFGFTETKFELARSAYDENLSDGDSLKLLKALKLPGETPAETKKILNEVLSKLERIVARLEDGQEFDFKAELTQLGGLIKGKIPEAKEQHSFRDLLTNLGSKIFEIADGHGADPEYICDLCGFNIAQIAVLSPYFSKFNMVSESTSQNAAEAIFLNVSDVPGLIKKITTIADGLKSKQERDERLSRSDFARISNAIARAKIDSI
ncbi:MAG: hypothetical protein NT157_02175, partial [Candidatus Micrarchaeota archaeon]|nr:hypothetical protein [Candidatus Micrarchaeota archaeon]